MTTDTTGVPSTHWTYTCADGRTVRIGRHGASILDTLASGGAHAVIDLARSETRTYRGHDTSIGLGYAAVQRVINAGLAVELPEAERIVRNGRPIRTVRITPDGLTCSLTISLQTGMDSVIWWRAEIFNNTTGETVWSGRVDNLDQSGTDRLRITWHPSGMFTIDD